MDAKKRIPIQQCRHVAEGLPDSCVRITVTATGGDVVELRKTTPVVKDAPRSFSGRCS